MTIAEAILFRLGRGPASMPQLADAIVEGAKVPPDKMYSEGIPVVSQLIKEGRIELLSDISLYRLTTKGPGK
jgi:hypothetical protein